MTVSLDDQIDLIARRQAQIGRVLSQYTGKERDYPDLKKESDTLLAVLRTLSSGNAAPTVPQSEGSNTSPY